MGKHSREKRREKREKGEEMKKKQGYSTVFHQPQSPEKHSIVYRATSLENETRKRKKESEGRKG